MPRATAKDCRKDHRHDPRFEGLPGDQGGAGRHHCAGCAYDKGFEDGIRRREVIELRLDELPESQASVVRHKSPHAAWAMGYMDGVAASYK